ncbi:hypothetical protein HK16_04505 [Acetobacter senegalensis]|uniref:ANTAR domain-containing protein n=2 Tax=Acetobacter TaxID=434 RepID=A0A252EE18_9PROT|nr:MULTISPECIES: hypothetical protein [Acetobacter]ATJ90680.1 hypothetical protein CIW82_08265 [Acetobacter tropicalis]OUL64542.1 hypothetical protein HK16_04505 [Acetobacter senegalensis]
MRNIAEEARLTARNAGLMLALQLAVGMLSRRDQAELARILSARAKADRHKVDVHDALEIVSDLLTPTSLKQG